MKMAQNVKFDPKHDAELIAKLQAVGAYSYLRINTLAKKLLHQRLDELITEYGITLSGTQPPGLG